MHRSTTGGNAEKVTSLGELAYPSKILSFAKRVVERKRLKMSKLSACFGNTFEFCFVLTLSHLISTLLMETEVK